MADIAVEEAIIGFRRLSEATIIETSDNTKLATDHVTAETTNGTTEPGDEDKQYPKGVKLAAISISLIFVLVALGLDVAIVAVAVPAISDEFHSIQDIAWYSTALRLVMCSFMFLFGKAYTLFSVKWLFIMSLAVFEAGNVLCTFAQSSSMFIAGRAICGLGASGLSGGAFTILTHAFPLRQRALVGGIGGAVETLACVAAPLIGGGLITGWTWRACFGINIPLGTIGCGVMLVYLKLDPNPDESLPLKDKIKRLDLIGTSIFAPSIVCLLLALQWGGTVYDWNDARIIVLFVLFGVLFCTFLLVEWKLGESASLPFRILGNRSLLSGSLFALCCNSVISTVEYFISIYFQGVRGYTAEKSGIFALPMIIGMCIAAPSAGAFTTWIGYYYPTMYLASICMSVSVGVLTVMNLDTNLALILCMVALMGFGVGSGIQAPSVAAQTILPVKEVSIGLAIVQFGSQIGPVILIAASTTLFTNRLNEEISIHSPSTNLTLLDNTGLTSIRNVVDPNSLEDVLTGFNDAIVQTLYLPLAFACLSIVGAVCIERKSVKTKKTMATKSEASNSEDKQPRQQENEETVSRQEEKGVEPQ